MTSQSHLFQPTFGSASSLALVQQSTDNAPLDNNNFPRKAFLEDCQKAGLLDVIAKGGVAP
jgi:hypothetical protein